LGKINIEADSGRRRRWPPMDPRQERGGGLGMNPPEAGSL
jgi:hypothetical protein